MVERHLAKVNVASSNLVSRFLSQFAYCESINVLLHDNGCEFPVSIIRERMIRKWDPDSLVWTN